MQKVYAIRAHQAKEWAAIARDAREHLAHEIMLGRIDPAEQIGFNTTNGGVARELSRQTLTLYDDGRQNERHSRNCRELGRLERQESRQ
jgi:hypothetical protein